MNRTVKTHLPTFQIAPKNKSGSDSLNGVRQTWLNRYREVGTRHVWFGIDETSCLNLEHFHTSHSSIIKLQRQSLKRPRPMKRCLRNPTIEEQRHVDLTMMPNVFEHFHQIQQFNSTKMIAFIRKQEYE